MENNETKLYIVLYSHRHGLDTWPVFASEAPDEDEIIEELRAGDVWDERDDADELTYLEVRGPFPASP